MVDLRSRAAALLRGPCCFSQDEPRPTAVALITRYVRGEPCDEPELRNQLSRCLKYAQTQASGSEQATGPARDAQTFYQNAGAILAEIHAEVSTGRGRGS